MEEKSFKIKQWWRAGLLIFGIYTLIWLFQLPQVYALASDDPENWWQILLRSLFSIYTWALLTPAVLFVGKLLPINRKHLIRNLSIHFFLGIMFSLAYALILNLSLLTMSIPLTRVFANFTIPYLFAVITTHTIHYTAVMATYQSYLYFREAQDQEFRLQQAQLQMFKAQLHPHFLFNTINAISALIYEEPEIADETLTELSHLLRLSLKSGKHQETSLKNELIFLQKYLNIHQTLMKERLKLRWQIDPKSLDASIPNMILQPLVENAIRHGIAPLERGGCIQVKAQRLNGVLCLQVEDDGAGLTSKNTDNGGIGLANTKARLQHIYGVDQEFSLQNSPSGGVRVTIKLPYRRSADMENEYEELDINY